MATEKTLPGAFLHRRRERPPEPAAALGADPLEAWRKVFPTVRGKSLGEDGHFLQSEAPDEVNRELLAFLSEGTPEDSHPVTASAVTGKPGCTHNAGA
jgi:pimeloyl-ACP methyl ester carboxylesterase